MTAAAAYAGGWEGLTLPKDQRLERVASGTLSGLVYGPGLRRTIAGLILAVVGTGAVTAIGLARDFDPAATRPGFALVILVASLLGGLWPGLLAALAGFGSYIFFLVRPAEMLRFGPGDLLVLIAFVAVAVVVAALSSVADAAKLGRRRLAFLAEANTLLSSSLDFPTTLAKVVRLAVPTLGDWCAIQLPGEPGRDPEVQVAHSDPQRLEVAMELMRRYPPDYSDEDSPVVQVMRSGKPLLLSTIPDELLRRAARDEEHLRMIRDLGLRSAIIVPLQARGRVFGALTLGQAESGRTYRATDLAVAEQLARSAATALDNARLYRERSEVARTLSQSLLPATLPEIPGVEVAARFRPAGEGNLVGGDFYDVFETGDGEWVVVIGDVCGKGPEAAALTGLVRHTVRAVSVRERRPSAVLDLVNRQIQLDDTDRFCTVAFGRLQQNGDGDHRLTVACGGHPPPLLLRSRRSVEAADSRGQLLGVLDRPELVDRPVQLEGGDVVLFYTDGVTEPFDRAGVPAEARLVSVLWSCAEEDAAGIAQRIEREVMEFTGGPPRDDVAIMVLRVRPTD
jgi:serine phosphatase RsbU (regulator of sigma subunit)